ncbi:unnamed protein product [Closterium sp. NIES-54]
MGPPLIAPTMALVAAPAVPVPPLVVKVTKSSAAGLVLLVAEPVAPPRYSPPLPEFSSTPTEPTAVSSAVDEGPVAAPCSCRLLSHKTILWHHHLGHPSLPRLRGMHSRLLVSGLPRSLPLLPPSSASPCLLCVEGGQRAAPHSSLFPPTNAPLQTLDRDVWGPARVIRLQLRERFRQDLPVLRLHSDRGGEFSSDLLWDFFMEVARASMIHAAAPHFLWPFAVRYAAHQLNLWPRVSFPATSPTLRWTGEVGDASVFRVWGSRAFVRDTSVDKLSSRAIPCVFLGFPPDAPGWQIYHPTSRRVLPSQDVTFDKSVPFYRLFPYRTAPLPPPPLFLALGPPLVDPLPTQGPAPPGVSQVDPLPLAEPVEVAVDSGAPRGAESEGAESGGAEPGGADPGGTEPDGAEPGSADSEGAASGGAEPRGTASAGGPAGTGAGGAGDVCPRGVRTRVIGAAKAGGVGDPGAGGTGAGDRGAGGTCAGCAGAGGAGAGGAGARGAGAGGTGAGGAGAGGTGARDPGAGGAGDGDPGAGGAGAGGAGDSGFGAGGNVKRRPFIVPPPRSSMPPPDLVLHQVLSLPSSTGLTPSLLCPPPHQSQPHAISPAVSFASLADGPDPESDLARAASPTVSHLLPTVVTDPSFESTTASALVAELVEFVAACRLDYAASLVAESDSDCPPSVGGECAFGTDVLENRQEDFEYLLAAVPHLVVMLLAPEGDPDARDIPTPRSYAEAISGFSQGKGVDFFQTFSPTLKMTTLRVSLHVAAQRDYELHSLEFSIAFSQSSLHEENWLHRPPDFTGSFPAGTQGSLRRPIYGLRQTPHEWHDTQRTTLATLGFAPLTADPSLFLRTDTSLPPFYVLVYVDELVFATADTKALTLVKSELQKRHTCTDLGELRSYLGLQITRDRARRSMTLTQSHMVHQVLQRFGFRYSSPQSTPLPTGHSLSAPPSDESVDPTGPYPELVGCLMYLMTCTRPDCAYPLSILARYVEPGRHRLEHWEAAKRVLRYLCSTSGTGLVLGGRGPVVLTGHADASWVDDLATLRPSQGYTFSLGCGSVSWRSTRSSSVLSSSCEAEIYAGANAAQELRLLTCLLTDLGERPRSSPVLYVDNKAMIALCREHSLEHRTKHISLRYFLARELQQRGQLRLAYVATRANTANIFTKALQSGDHERFCTILGLVPTLPHLLTT